MVNPVVNYAAYNLAAELRGGFPGVVERQCFAVVAGEVAFYDDDGSQWLAENGL